MGGGRGGRGFERDGSDRMGGEGRREEGREVAGARDTSALLRRWRRRKPRRTWKAMEAIHQKYLYGATAVGGVLV